MGKYIFNLETLTSVAASGSVNADGKVLTRKPRKAYNGDWCFSIDDAYRNTFYKKEPVGVDAVSAVDE